MQLPSDYLAIVNRGAGALHSVAARLRVEAGRDPSEPQLWLAVRDCEGLAERLVGLDDWTWRHGYSDFSVTGQDLGVLDELLADEAQPVHALSGDETTLLKHLRDFLQGYFDRAFELDDPAA